MTAQPNRQEFKPVLLVYKRGRQRAASRWLIAIGNRKGHKAALHSEKQFKQNEAKVSSSMPVIFIGLGKRAEQIRDVCPKVFSDYGATCRMAQSRAVISCSWPSGLTELQAKGRAQEIAEKIEQLTGDKSGFTLANAMPEPPAVDRSRRRHSSRGWLDQSLDLAKKYSGADLAVDYTSDKNIRDRYVELLYLYAAARFVTEYLDEFTSK